MKKVLVPIADGTEEIEAVCIIDVLRRAGAEVTVASVGPLEITASRGVRIVADSFLADCVDVDYDLIALPGGIPGAENLRDSIELEGLLKRQARADRFLGAICASPAVVFETHGLLKGRRATTHPGFVDRLGDPSAARSRVVVDGNIVTSRGPGTALEFSIELVALLYGRDHADAVAGPMVMPENGH